MLAMTYQTLKLLLILWRFYDMSKNTMGIIKGVGTGLAAGMAVGFVGSQMMKNQKQVKRKANKAMHAVGDLLENVQYMFKS